MLRITAETAKYEPTYKQPNLVEITIMTVSADSKQPGGMIIKKGLIGLLGTDTLYMKVCWMFYTLSVGGPSQVSYCNQVGHSTNEYFSFRL